MPPNICKPEKWCIMLCTKGVFMVFAVDKGNQFDT